MDLNIAFKMAIEKLIRAQNILAAVICTIFVLIRNFRAFLRGKQVEQKGR